MALDFLELWFRCQSNNSVNQGVDAINNIFREEGIGYEFTLRQERESDKTINFFGRPRKTIDIQHPEPIVKDNELIHSDVVKPCLNLLAHEMFSVANQEMLEAFSKYREGSYEDALTSCGAAFESVLKTICAKKRWIFDPDKDTCAKLVDICYKHGLFDSFYVELFKSVGTVRNKLSDAHGRGPTPLYRVDKAHVEHLIAFTASHIVFLAKLADVN